MTRARIKGTVPFRLITALILVTFVLGTATSGYSVPHQPHGSKATSSAIASGEEATGTDDVAADATADPPQVPDAAPEAEPPADDPPAPIATPQEPSDEPVAKGDEPVERPAAGQDQPQAAESDPGAPAAAQNVPAPESQAPEATAEIRGIKYHDLDFDGTRDAGEEGLAGWTMILTSASLPGWQATVVTGADGSFAFTGLVAATYAITEVELAGWHNTNGLPHFITVLAGQVSPCTDSQIGSVEDHPELTLTRSADPMTYLAAGDVINFTYTVRNSGNVGFHAPFSITDDKVSVVFPNIDILAPGAEVSFTADYVVTPADIDAGVITSTAVARVVGYIESNAATITLTSAVAPALSLTKVAEPPTYVSVGDVITYRYTLTNSGNVALIGPFTITDDQVAVAPSAATVLAPSESLSFTATHIVTAADVASGSIVNHAVGQAFYHTTRVQSAEATAWVALQPRPSLSIDKASTTPNFFRAGETIHYTYTVTNTGNVSVAGPFSVVDDVLGTLAAPQAPALLAPGQSFTVSGDYIVTATDVAVGSVMNVARAVAGSVESNNDTVTVPAVRPAISVEKTSDAPETGVAQGTLVTYTYVVRNTGDQPLTGVTLVDDRLGTVVSNITLGVGEMRDFRQSVTIGEDTTNTVVATGVDGFGHEVSDTATASVLTFAPFTPPDLEITKIADRTEARPGDLITYTIRFRNVGQSGAQGITIVDDFDEVHTTVASGNGGIVANGTITWTVFEDRALLDTDGWYELRYTLRVNDALEAQIVNVDNVAVISVEGEAVTDNNTDTARVVVRVPLLPVEEAGEGDPGSEGGDAEDGFLPFTGGAFPDPTSGLIAALGAVALLVALRKTRREDEE